MALHSHNTQKVDGTLRIEAYSDAVFAIVVTLLILEVHVPYLSDTSVAGVIQALHEIGPKLISFVFSFVTISIFWVNHHHFYHQLNKSDWPLLWNNNFLLFWMTITPFATAFLGDYPTVPAVVAIYAVVLCMGAFAFRLMSGHAYFHSDLVGMNVTKEQRKAAYNRSLPGVILYALAAASAFVSIWISWALLIIVPVLYFVPSIMEEVDGGSADH